MKEINISVTSASVQTSVSVFIVLHKRTLSHSLHPHPTTKHTCSHALTHMHAVILALLKEGTSQQKIK